MALGMIKTLSVITAVTATLLIHVEASNACGGNTRNRDKNCLIGRTKFDIYTFAQSWQPEFCAEHSDDNYEGCSSPEDFWESSFTIHGLWPDLNSTRYPCFCSNEAIDMDAIESTVSLDTLKKYWPNVKASSDDNYPHFWCTEWLKHGTCSGLGQPGYFKAAVDLAKQVKTPSVVVKNVGGTVSADDVREAYGGEDAVILRCKNGVLSEVHTCWSLGSDNVPATRVSCTAKKYEDNCDGEIHIASF